MATRRWAWLGIAIVGLAACSPPGSGQQQSPPADPPAQEYTVLADAEAPPGIQISAYFPGTLQARAGDTIRFENRGPNAPHTITFGVAAHRSDAPLPVTSDGQLNPVVFGPCVTSQAPTAGLAACPEPPGGPPPVFDGQGLWNSGVLAPAAPSVPADQTSTVVRLADDIAPGRYAYVCLLHPLMNGVVEVVDGSSSLPSPAEIAEAGERDASAAILAATAVEQPEAAAPAGARVNAGWGDAVVAVNQFGPGNITVPAGTTVTWTSRSPYEPHTITFGQPPFAGPDDPSSLMPGGATPGGDYTRGFAHSGFIGPAPGFPTDAYALRFTTRGTYHYVCLLHPGMEGDVTVT
ncbi:MAG: cupredoxin domain-containing protein [Egibacteraceae bacterium]